MSSNAKLSDPQRSALLHAARSGETYYCALPPSINGRTVRSLVRLGLLARGEHEGLSTVAITAAGRAALGSLPVLPATEGS